MEGRREMGVGPGPGERGGEVRLKGSVGEGLKRMWGRAGSKEERGGHRGILHPILSGKAGGGSWGVCVREAE